MSKSLSFLLLTNPRPESRKGRVKSTKEKSWTCFICFIETCFPNKNKKLYPDISAIQATFLICPVLVCGGRTHNILRIPQLFCPRGHVQLLLPRSAGALDPALPLVEALHYQAADDAVHHLHHSRVAASVHRVQLSQGERFSSKLQPHLQDQVRT